MKKYLILVLILGLCIISGRTYAQTTQNIWITVSVVASADIVVPNASTVSNWNITGVSFNFVTNRVDAIIVSNAGAANEIFQLSVASLGSGWTNSTTTANGVNTYVLQGIFNSLSDAQATNSDFDSGDVVVADVSNASATHFGNALWSTNGDNVDPASKRQLWLRYVVPSGGLASPATPTCRLTISATLK